MVASMITNTRYVLVTFEQMLKAAFFGAGGGTSVVYLEPARINEETQTREI